MDLQSTRRYLVILLVVGIFLALLLAVRSSRNPPEQTQTQVRETKKVSAPIPFADRRKRASELRSTVPVTSVQEQAANAVPSYRFNVSQERREMLKEITGLYPHPVIQPRPGQESYTMNEVLEMYPFLRNRDGGINMEASEKIQALLNADLKQTHERMALLQKTQDLDTLRPQYAVRRVDSPAEQIMALTASLQERPKRINPTEEMLIVSSGYARLNLNQMTGFLHRIAIAQTDLEKGRPLEHCRGLVQTFSPRLNPPMTDEQADKLLATPLNKLAIGEFVPKP